MQTAPNTAGTRLAVDEKTLSESICMSLAWLRKDRATKRLLPFYRIGTAVRYDMARVREALARLEEGGAK